MGTYTRAIQAPWSRRTSPPLRSRRAATVSPCTLATFSKPDGFSTAAAPGGSSTMSPRTEQIRVADLSPDGLLAVLAEVANLPPSQPVPEVRSHYPSLAWHAFMMSMNSSWLMVSANTAKRST